MNPQEQAKCFWCGGEATVEQDEEYTDIKCEKCGVLRISGGKRNTVAEDINRIAMLCLNYVLRREAKAKEANTVIIAVRKGLAELEQKPEGVKVIIRDYDTQDEDIPYSEFTYE